jgi:ABC-2 type transport system permease protein
MSDVGLVGRQVRAEQRSFWRNPAAAGFTIIFPVMLLVVFATLNSGTHLSSVGGISFVAYYVPGIVGYAVITACFANLAMNLTRQREDGTRSSSRSSWRS